ncbi:hypothetical protein Ancab_032911 [Ancistrocladus abbreviatus]
MSRKPIDSDPSRWASMILLLTGLASCTVAYMVISILLRSNNGNSSISEAELLAVEASGFGLGLGRESGECCRGIQNLELWGAAVKWGTDFKLNSSEECCKACKAMCTGDEGPCLCDSWVFCGNKKTCGSKFGECWLKKQMDSLAPERQEAGNKVMWTSGLIFGKGEGIIGLETEQGTLHIKASFGPPFALIQGTLAAQGTGFTGIPSEFCPTIRRGSVAWVGSGPEFFISLANHKEWKKAYTVFGFVLPKDMGIAEKIARLPTKSDIWNNINVSLLHNPVPLKIRRIKTRREDPTQ